MNGTTVNSPEAIGHLMDLLTAEGLSGGEGPVAGLIKKKLLAAGCKPAWIIENCGKSQLHGEVPVAYISLKETMEATAAELRAFCLHISANTKCRKHHACGRTSEKSGGQNCQTRAAQTGRG
jgi:hypothetical protein